jgi:hypothetical protein
MTPKVPGLLARYIQQKRCVVFVGAGLSAGAGLPTWSKLLLNGIEQLVADLPEGDSHQKELQGLVERGKLLEVADFCKEKLGAEYHQFLTQQVRGDQAQIPKTHKVLMHLPFSAWVTTNYDKLLERAFTEVLGGSPKTLTHKDTEVLGRLLFDGGQFILKAHGDIDRPETVVLTSRDYSEIIHSNPAFNEAFSGLMLTKALFFVGYSLSDPDFRLLLDRQLTHFKGFVPERFALMMDVGPVERDVLWRTARIRVLSYEKDQHGQVLEFLEALKAVVHPAPAPAAPAAQPAQVRSSNVAVPPRRLPWFLGGLSRDSGPMDFSAEAEDALEANDASEAPAPVSMAVSPAPGSSAPVPPQSAGAPPPASARPSLETVPRAGPMGAAPSPPSRAPVLQPVSTEPSVLVLERFVAGMVRFRVLRQGEAVAEGVAPAKLNEDVSQLLHRAVSENKGTELPASLYAELTRLFEKHAPRKVFDALAERGASAQELRVPTRLSRFPWELLPIQGQPMCLQRPLVRAPVGVSAKARGTPELRSVPRVLLIEGLGGARGGGAREIDRLMRQYQGAEGLFSCKVLRGADATFFRIMAELDAGMPDLLHYTGDVGQQDGEPFLRLPDGIDILPAEALRSALSQGRLPFLVMNAPSSAFVPPAFGVSAVEGQYRRMRAPASSSAVFEGQEGFMDLATQMGVGAFIGAFDMPGAQAGTAFMAALHHALASGLPAAEAVLQARKQTLKEFPGDPTALQYVLSGDGNLQLWDSRREAAPE